MESGSLALPGRYGGSCELFRERCSFVAIIHNDGTEVYSSTVRARSRSRHACIEILLRVLLVSSSLLLLSLPTRHEPPRQSRECLHEGQHDQWPELEGI